MKVTQMKSPRTNRAVANQFIIYNGNETWFQSYNSIIVKVVKGKTILDSKYWDYSRTTSKYRNIFLGETTEETKKKIKSGEYILVDMNTEL